VLVVFTGEVEFQPREELLYAGTATLPVPKLGAVVIVLDPLLAAVEVVVLENTVLLLEETEAAGSSMAGSKDDGDEEPSGIDIDGEALKLAEDDELGSGEKEDEEELVAGPSPGPGEDAGGSAGS
jgi:hypothetical protein